MRIDTFCQKLDVADISQVFTSFCLIDDFSRDKNHNTICQKSFLQGKSVSIFLRIDVECKNWSSLMDQEREKVNNRSKTYNWSPSFQIVLELRMSCHYVDKKIDVSFEYVASFLDGGSPNMKYQSTSITEGLLSVRICRELKTMYSHKLLIFKHFLFHTIKGSLAFCVCGGASFYI